MLVNTFESGTFLCFHPPEDVDHSHSKAAGSRDRCDIMQTMEFLVCQKKKMYFFSKYHPLLAPP